MISCQHYDGSFFEVFSLDDPSARPENFKEIVGAEISMVPDMFELDMTSDPIKVFPSRKSRISALGFGDKSTLQILRDFGLDGDRERLTHYLHLVDKNTLAQLFGSFLYMLTDPILTREKIDVLINLFLEVGLILEDLDYFDRIEVFRQMSEHESFAAFFRREDWPVPLSVYEKSLCENFDLFQTLMEERPIDVSPLIYSFGAACTSQERFEQLSKYKPEVCPKTLLHFVQTYPEQVHWLAQWTPDVNQYLPPGCDWTKPDEPFEPMETILTHLAREGTPEDFFKCLKTLLPFGLDVSRANQTGETAPMILEKRLNIVTRECNDMAKQKGAQAGRKLESELKLIKNKLKLLSKITASRN